MPSTPASSSKSSQASTPCASVTTCSSRLKTMPFMTLLVGGRAVCRPCSTPYGVHRVMNGKSWPADQSKREHGHMTRTADFPGLKNRYLIDSSSTDGRFALIEHRIPPRTLAAPMHTHEREDEYSYVLSGRVGAQIGDDTVDAGPGELV